MKKIKLTSVLLTVWILTLCVPVFAQQVTQEQIQYGTPVVVNFQQLADYELAHPGKKKKKRFIEQGEDREKGGTFIPQPVAPDAYRFNIQPPAPAKEDNSGSNNRITSQAPVTSFNGILDNGTLIPPDIRGAAGATNVMETTNQQFKVYTKTGSLVSTLTISTLFAASGGSGYFDPHILYDANNSRWVICVAGNLSNGHSGAFLAVSQTSSATGSWNIYSVDGTGNTSDFLDYPLLGLNTNWVVITGRDFLGTGSVHPKVFVFNRATVYAGSAGTATAFTDPSNSLTLAPAQTYDNSQTTEYIVCNWNGNSGGSGFVRLSSVTGTASSPSYSTGSTIGVAAPWNDNASISVGASQSGSTVKIESGDSRIGNALFINGSLWFSHTVYLPASSSTHSSIDWWQVNPVGPVIQQYGRVENTSAFYFYSSISVNPAGDALLGYCSSSSSSFASASYSFHAAADPASTMQSIFTYKAGLASYNKTFGSGRNRYGDYSGSALDPSDNSFWNFSEWAQTGNNWGTVIANVAPSTGTSCNAPTGLSATSITASSATLNWGAASGAVSYNIQYRQTGTGTWTSTTSSTTSKAISGLSASTQYEFQVQTVCSGSSSGFSASSNFTTSGAACSDIYEPNNSKTTPATIAINTTIDGLITPSGDNDYYQITTVAPNTNLKITLSNLPADYDLRLFSSANALLKTSQNGGLTDEVITRNVTTAATYKIRVYGSGGSNNATQCYTLTTLTSSTPLRTTADAEANIDNASVLSIYPNPVKDVMNINFNSSAAGNISINIADMVGKTVLNVQKAGIKGMNNFEFSMKDLNKGIYFVEVNNGVEKEIKKIVVSK